MLLELVDRAFRMRGHQTLAGAIHQQIHFLQQCLADQHFIAQDQRVVAGAALHNLEAHAFRNADGALAAIREFDGHLIIRLDPQSLQQRCWNARPDCTSVHHRIGFNDPHPLWRQPALGCGIGISIVEQPDRCSDFTHVRSRVLSQLHGRNITPPRTEYKLTAPSAARSCRHRQRSCRAIVRCAGAGCISPDGRNGSRNRS